MRITSIEYMKLFVPWKDSFREPMASWRNMSGTTPEEEDAYVVIRVHTDEGLVGIGVAAGVDDLDMVGLVLGHHLIA